MRPGMRIAHCRRRSLRLTGFLLPVMIAGTAGACATPPATHPAGTHVVLQRGTTAGESWKLVAWEDSGTLALWLMSAKGQNYSGAEDWSTSGPMPPTGFWEAGYGPGNTPFYFGPAPSEAARTRLTAKGYPAVTVRTSPLPSGYGLPRARYFIARLPGSVSVSWTVTLLDSAGRRVPFHRY